ATYAYPLPTATEAPVPAVSSVPMTAGADGLPTSTISRPAPPAATYASEPTISRSEPPMPSVVRPTIVGVDGATRLTTARSTCDGLPATGRRPWPSCPASPPAAPSRPSAPTVLGAVIVPMSPTRIPSLRPPTTASVPETATRWPSKGGLAAPTAPGAPGLLTSTPDSPNSDEAPYASPLAPSTTTSFGVPTPGTNPVSPRLAHDGVLADAGLLATDTLPALSTAATA